MYCIAFLDPAHGQNAPINSGLFILPSFHPEVFSELIQFFLKLSMVLEAHVVLCMTAGFLEKKNFCPKNGPKIDFLNLLENVINFFWIWSIKKVYIKCCILAQIPYFGKIWFLRYGPKCSLSIRLQDFYMVNIKILQSDWQRAFWRVSLEETDEKAWFFACWYRFMEIKSWSKSIVVGVVQNCCNNSGLRTLKLAVSQEGIRRINWFLVCW